MFSNHSSLSPINVNQYIFCITQTLFTEQNKFRISKYRFILQMIELIELRKINQQLPGF